MAIGTAFLGKLRLSDQPSRSAAVLFVLGMALTLLAYKLTHDADRESLQLELKNVASRHAADVRKAIDYSLQVVDSLSRFYESSRQVSAREFHSFTQPLVAGEPNIHALEWAPRVTQAERHAFEAEARTEGLTGFRITQWSREGSLRDADRRDEYFPLRLIAPLTGNEKALGFDVSTRPERQPILESVRDSGEALVSDVFQPVHGMDGQSAFVIFSPAYRAGMSKDTVAARREAFEGYAIGLIRVGDLLATSLRAAKQPGLTAELRDVTDADAPVTLHALTSDLSPAVAGAPTGFSALEHHVPLGVPGRQWELYISATPEFARVHSPHRAKYVLASGLLLTLLLSLYLSELLRRRWRVMQLAGDLSRSNLELQAVSQRLTNLVAAAPMGIVAIDREERLIEWNPAAERMFGWRRDELLGRPPPMMERSDARTFPAVKQGQAITGVEALRRRKDGTWLPVRIAGAPLRDPDGHFDGLLRLFEDLSEVERAQQDAHRRDAMLEAVNNAIRLLLQTEHWSRVMPDALHALASAVEVDRAFLWAFHRAADGTRLVSRQFAWYGEGIPTLEPFRIESVPYQAMGLTRIVEILARGEVLQGNVIDFPDGERVVLESLGVVSILTVPIHVGDELWGFIGFDTCRASRDWGPEEVRMLRIATEGVGAAIRRQRFEQHLSQSALVFEHTVDSVIITDAKSRILDVNPAFTEITGYRREDAIGQKPSLIKSNRHGHDFYRSMWDVLLREGLWSGEIWDRRKSGELFPARLTIRAVTDEAGDPTHYVGVMSDLSSLRNTQDRLEYLANHDLLTELPNKRLFAFQLEQGIKRSASANAGLALLHINIDRFKDVNNSLGHPAGDTLLQQLARRLVATLREEDLLARHGGVGFLAMLDQVSDAQGAALLAERVLDALAKPFRIDGQELFLSATIGISLWPENGEDAEILLRNADAAMSRAKEMNRGGYQFYTDDLTGRARERISLGTDLRRAIDEQQLELYFQPQVALRSGRVLGAEALLRWHHPKHGMVSPAQFIPLAEELGLIVPIGDWVLRNACRIASTWCESVSGFRRIAVNVAGQQLTPKFVATVRGTLAETGLPPACLELEVTESFVMSEGQGAIDILYDLKALGVELAIDDFGTGYSSLSYLKHLPVDKLKIDQSFVRGIPAPDDEALARAVIALARSLNLQVIAEGVETALQRDFLEAEGCSEGQGYLFSKPRPREEFEKLLEDNA